MNVKFKTIVGRELTGKVIEVFNRPSDLQEVYLIETEEGTFHALASECQEVNKTKGEIMMKKTLFVAQLPNAMQAQIEEELKNQGFAPEDISNALESRLSDLSDTLDISPYLCSEYRVTFHKDNTPFFECTVAHKNAEMAVNKAKAMFERLTTVKDVNEFDFSFRYIQ